MHAISKSSPDTFESDSHLSSVLWLTQLRWVAVAGQLLVIGVVEFALRITVPWLPLLMLVGWTALSNLLLWLVGRYLNGRKECRGLQGDAYPVADDATLPAEHVSHKLLTSVLCMDVLTLTGLLYFSGGGSNPFLIFYFANLAVAGMLLPRSLAIVVACLSIASVAWLLNHALTIPEISQTPLSAEAEWGVSKFAFLIAFAACSGVVTYFVTRLSAELKRREQQLAVAEKERERGRRLEAMATLAAGAGHELATPLSTIAVVSKELSRNLEKYDVSPSIRRDVDLIREELNRCRDILHRMKSGAGEAAAENLHPISVEEVVRETIDAMREPGRVMLDVSAETAKEQGLLPKQALSQALRNLIQNGLDASPQDANISLRVQVVPPKKVGGQKSWTFTVTDVGSGLSDEVSRRIGEPFFTTKEVGKGMGLGVFLTRNVIHGLGGTLSFRANVPMGTVCVVEIPIQPTRIR